MTQASRSTVKGFLFFLFVTSLSTFFISLIYDSFRSQILDYLTTTLTQTTGGTLSPTSTTVEIMILGPCILLMPITHTIGHFRYNNNSNNGSGGSGSQHREHSLTTPKGGFGGSLTFLVLQAVTWTLWTAAVGMVVFAIFWRPGMLGILSGAAVVGMFAQGLMITSIFAYDDKSKGDGSSGDASTLVDIDGDADKRPDHLVKASEWSAPTKRGARARTASFVAAKKQRRKRDFLLFCAMNYALLQTPMIIIKFYQFTFKGCVDCLFGASAQQLKDIPAVFALVCTLGIPLFTHGVGGVLFHPEDWTFFHPLKGGSVHVKFQAAGWTLLACAGLLQIANLVLGTSFGFLLHSGNVLGWCAEGLLLYSLFAFDQGREKVDEVSATVTKDRNFVEFVVSVAQDMFCTNLHWIFVVWLVLAPCGLDVFSLNPLGKLFNVSPIEAALILLKTLVFFCLPAILLPYSPTKKPTGWAHPITTFIHYFECALLAPYGLYRQSRIELEDKPEVYQQDGCMFAIAPHGTLPLSVWAVWHQKAEIFDKVCLFFGSQVAIVPGYRMWTGARGGCMPVTKKNLLACMKKRQNVALVPGGVSEMMKCVPFGDINVSIKHKGFVRIAMQEGFDLVPILMLHENDMYNNPLKDFQNWCYKVSGVPMGLPYYTNRWYLPCSNRKPLRTVLGKRLKVKKVAEPTSEEVDALHRLFYQEVLRCWEKHHEELGYGEREFVYVT
jgi:2-acylglycerol O-acyltransferase 2